MAVVPGPAPKPAESRPSAESQPAPTPQPPPPPQPVAASQPTAPSPSATAPLSQPAPPPRPAPAPAGLVQLVTVAVVTVVVTAAFLGTLVFDTGSRGRPENLVLDDQTVARTAYQPLIDPRQIVYPQDYPIELQLLRLPAGVELERIDAIDIYRLDGQVVAYTAQGRVAPLADTAEVMRQALTVPGYELEFWLEQSSNRPGDFTARWSPSPA